ncbi:MAG: TonB-dependent receptor [Gemmatimonadota bacterium]
MRLRPSSLFGLFALGVALMAAPAHAQTGTVTGQVIDAETRQPVQGAQIQVLRGGAGADGTLSDAQGRFRLQLPVGTYVFVIEYLGYTPQRLDQGGGVEVRAGETTEITVELVSTALQLAGLEVTTRRSGDATKATESPNHVVIVSDEAIQRRAAVTPVDHVKALPGVDVSQTGIGSSNVVTRGFNNVFSGALLVLTDNRIAGVPSLRVNAPNMIPANDFDTERIEVLLGPAAALYGPNSASGVMHIITASPIDRTGTKVRLSGGERSVFMGQFRTAFNFGPQGEETFGFKVSGQYMRGNEWECWSPSIPAEDQTICDRAEFTLNQENPELPDRNYDLERWSGEARFDWRPSDDTELIVTGGLNNLGSSIEMTGVGSGQANDWRYGFGQARFRTGRFFAQAFINQSDAGETILLRSGEPIVDKSRLMVAQLQHGFDLGGRLDLIYGADFQFTRPRTEGTITGANEDDDDIDEIGGYLHSETVLSESLKLVAALRVDYHNRLEDLVYSPRAALVFEPLENQTFRLSYNRAFSTPTTNNLFLDLAAGRIPITDQIGYGVRTRGVPETGFTFNETCPGGVQDFCMFSPFAPQAGRIPANGLPLWDALIFQVLASQGAEALAPALQNPGANPTDPAIGSRFLRFDQEGAAVGAPFGPDPGVTDIGRIDPTIFNSFEVGYQGILGNRLLVQADLYTQQIKDFVGPLRTETPNVFYDPESVQAYVLQRLQDQGLLGTVVSPEDAAAIIEAMASIPLGTVAPDQTEDYCERSGNRPGCATDLILTYRNFGDVDLWGGDLAFQLLATDRLSFTGSYSHVSEECFDFDDDGSCSGAEDIALNAPQNKGSLGALWNDVQAGFSVDARVRFTEGFPMNSGVFVGMVEAYTVVDASLNYKLPWIQGASVGITATNLLDNVHQEFVGAPFMGRLVLAQMTYEF